MTYPLRLKERVAELRKSGGSISEIASVTGLAKSTVSMWVRDIQLSKEVRSKLLDKKKMGKAKGLRTLAEMRERRRNELASEAVKAIEGADLDDKAYWSLCAALLFWCEGSKDLSGVVFTNSDQALMATFLRALRRGFDLDERKFSALIHLHEYHDAPTQTDFWSGVTGIPITRFNRPYLKPHTGKRKRSGYQGCLSLRYGDATLAQKLSALYHAFAQYHGGA